MIDEEIYTDKITKGSHTYFFDIKKNKYGGLYKLTDFYTLFYYKFIKTKKRDRFADLLSVSTFQKI